MFNTRTAIGALMGVLSLSSVSMAAEIKFGIGVAEGDYPEYNAVLRFKEYVEFKTNGEITVRLFPGNQLGGEREMLEQVQQGSLELTLPADGAMAGFYPWLTIEDPEVGMRFWTNGKKLGVIENPLIEEVPLTFAHGITQRKRWVAGFFQSLTYPLQAMGMPWPARIKAWFNFLPCLSLSLNSVGIPLGLWASWSAWSGNNILPDWAIVLSLVNLGAFGLSMGALYIRTWRRSALVLPSRRDRIRYLLRVNPVFIMGWWLIWLIPLWIGFRMFLRNEGLVWERTEKTDANHDLVRVARGRSGAALPAGAPALPTIRAGAEQSS